MEVIDTAEFLDGLAEPAEMLPDIYKQFVAPRLIVVLEKVERAG